MTPVTWATLRRALAARRRLVAAVLAGLAVLSALSVLRPAGPPTESVLAAARDLAPGVALTLADLRPVALPAAAVPAGALRPGAAVLGRIVAGPVRSGEPLTDVRLVGDALAAALAPGAVAVPVRFADAGAVALLRAGDRIDVLAAADDPTGLDPTAVDADPPGPRPPPTAPVARVVASDVVVLVVPAADPAGVSDGALVVVACPPAVARVLAAAAATARLSPALRAVPGGPP